jgi:hypothetical protein
LFSASALQIGRVKKVNLDKIDSQIAICTIADLFLTTADRVLTLHPAAVFRGWMQGLKRY